MTELRVRACAEIYHRRNFAKLLGVSQAKMGDWENGYHKVRREMLMDDKAQ